MKNTLLAIFVFISSISYGQIVTGSQYGKDAAGNTVIQPIGGKAISTSTSLGANASWSSPILFYNGNNNIQLAIQTNVSGSYLVEYYTKDSVKIPFMGTMVTFDPTVVNAFQAGIAGKADGVKITYINGSIAQSSFYLEIGLLNNPIQLTLRSMATPMSGTNFGGTEHSAIEGKDSSNGAAYRQATTTSVTNKVGLDVNVINRNNDTQKVSITNPATSVGVTNTDYAKDTSLHSGNAKTQIVGALPPVTVANPVTSLSVNNFPVFPDSNSTSRKNVLATITNPTTSVSVNNLPSNQTVTVSNPVNSVAVNNFPATQQISGNVNATLQGTPTVNANVTFPSTQQVSGTVALSNPYVVSPADSSKYRKVVTVDNFPTTQPVSGNINATIQGTPTVNANVTFPATQQIAGTVTANVDSTKQRSLVNIGNFPSTQTVNGTITANVANFPATQNVSITGFDSTKTRILQTVNVNGTVPVSAASLPLPTGASTSANQSAANASLNNIDLDLGASTDAAVTTANGSALALIKGTNTLLTSLVASSSSPFQPYFFPYLTNSAVQTLKSAAGTVGSIQISNPTSGDLYIQFFNTTGTVTLGTTVPTFVVPIDATQGNANFNNASGINFTTGIKYAITTTPNGNGAPNATIFTSIGYK